MKEKLVELLSNIHEAKELMEINDMLGLKTADELKELQDVVNELVEEYVLFCTKKGKYILLKNCPGLKIGKLSVSRKGFGFVVLDREDDIYVDDSNMNGAIHDDIVLVEVFTKGVRKEAKVIKIIKREFKNLVGEVFFDNGDAFIKLDDDKRDITIHLTKDSVKNCVAGHKVMVKVIKELGKKRYLAEVTKIIGHKDDPGTDILSIAYKHGIYEEFGKEVEDELEFIPTEVSEKELKDRKDLTGEVIFTIDGDDTKDIDDAISIKKLENGNYELGVHIADVSYYVKEDSPLDKAARDRGTSVYLTDRVIPMIPHQLSNGICSLNPNVDRLTVSCVMEVNNKGKVEHYDIFESVIKSRIQMTYNKVNDYLERDIVHPEYKELTDELSLMKELSDIIRKSKVARGCIDFDTDEIKILVDENGKPTEITKRERGVGEKLIEDFMIIANETVATHLFNMELPSLYRVHGEPSEERLIKFLNEIQMLGINIKEDIRKMSPFVVQHIIEELKRYPSFKVLNTQMLSCMDKAIYDVNNIGHFGIASRCYTHFTSPIRRYPDTTIHRLLHRYFFDKDGITEEKVRHYRAILPEIAAHSSDKERSSIECEREVDELKEAEYMEDHIGEEYHGMISSVTSFGFFVQLDNLIEGLVPIATLNGFYYNQSTDTIISERNKTVYIVGKEVDVRVVRASKEERIIDFELVGDNDGKEEKED